MFYTKLVLFMVGVLLLLSVFSYYRIPQTHYIGETPITPEQFTDITSHSASSISMFKKENYITTINGQFAYSYDFYSVNSYPYLTSRQRSFKDSMVVHFFFTNNNWLPDAIMIVLFAGVAYLLTNKRNKIYEIKNKIVHYLEHRHDNKIIVSGGRITYKPNNLTIGESKGIIAVRSWKLEKGVIKSIVQDTKWDNNELIADKLPNKNGITGIYGYRLGAFIKQSGNIMGIVEFNGQYEYHADGIIRAEHCKIIGFFMSYGLPNTARKVSIKYNVPVYLDESPEVAYISWLYSAQGQSALQYNFNLLGDEDGSRKES